MCFDNRSIGSIEREFREELSSSRAEQLTVVGVVGPFKNCPDAIFLGSSILNECLARADENPVVCGSRPLGHNSLQAYLREGGVRAALHQGDQS